MKCRAAGMLWSREGYCDLMLMLHDMWLVFINDEWICQPILRCAEFFLQKPHRYSCSKSLQNVHLQKEPMGMPINKIQSETATVICIRLNFHLYLSSYSNANIPLPVVLAVIQPFTSLYWFFVRIDYICVHICLMHDSLSIVSLHFWFFKVFRKLDTCVSKCCISWTFLICPGAFNKGQSERSNVCWCIWWSCEMLR